jgi:hypothetical protein
MSEKRRLEVANEEHLIRLKDGVYSWNKWRKANGEIWPNLINANLSDLSLIQANLRGSRLSGADLSGTNLSGADLSGADLSGANLTGVNLFRADLSGADLSGADLRGINLTDANVTQCSFLDGGDLTKAEKDDLNRRGANFVSYSYNSGLSAEPTGGPVTGNSDPSAGPTRGPVTGKSFPAEPTRDPETSDQGVPNEPTYSSPPEKPPSNELTYSPPPRRQKPTSTKFLSKKKYATSPKIRSEEEEEEAYISYITSHWAKPSPLLRYASIECPSQVTILQSFSLFIKLQRQPKYSGNVEIRVSNSGDLIELETVLRIHEHEFRVERSNMRLLEVVEDHDSEARFTVTPLQVGKLRLRADFYQDSRRIGSVEKDLQVVSEFSDSDDESSRSSENQVNEIEIKSSTVPPPDLELCIQLDHHDQRTLYFALHSSKEFIDYHHSKVGYISLMGSPLDKMQAVYEQMSNLASATPTTNEELISFERRTASLGNDLWDELIPEPLKQEYWKFYSKIRSFLITSDEPWVPWEMIKPYRYATDGKREDHPFWCQQFALSRWMSGPGTVDELTIKNIRPVVPCRVNLPAVNNEILFIQKITQLNSTIVPLETFHTSLQVLDWLEGDESSILHFACHGNFDARRPSDSSIILSDGSLRPSDIRVRFCGNRQRPIVFINACHGARMEFSMTGLGGWAQRWIESRVGSFIGAMWEVDDSSALEFTKCFYTALLQNRLPIAEAFRSAREQIRQSAPYNSTWLAYVLYADPEGRVTNSSTN